MAGHRLRPETKSALGRATARGIKGNIRIEEVRNIVLSEIKIPPKDVGNEREGVEVFDGRTVWIVDDMAILPLLRKLSILFLVSPC